MVAAAVIGGAVVGAGASIYAGNKAAGAQEDAANSSIGEQRRQFDINQRNQQPWLQAGTQALHRLQNVSIGNMSQFQTSPDYNFRRTEGQRGIQQTAAARGGAFSGNALKALSDYNSNLASGEFGNWWNRQAGLAGVGQSAANQIGAYGQNSANNISNALMAQGDARASGVLGTANGISNSINSGIGNYFGYQNYLNSQLTPIQTTAKYM